MSEEIAHPETQRDELDLSRYMAPSQGSQLQVSASYHAKAQNHRMRDEEYWVILPVKALSLSIHRTATKVLAYLYLQSKLSSSQTVVISFQRAKRFFKLSCSRKTFYRAINELEQAGAIETKRGRGRNIEALLLIKMGDAAESEGLSA